MQLSSSTDRKPYRQHEIFTARKRWSSGCYQKFLQTSTVPSPSKVQFQLLKTQAWDKESSSLSWKRLGRNVAVSKGCLLYITDSKMRCEGTAWQKELCTSNCCLLRCNSFTTMTAVSWRNAQYCMPKDISKLTCLAGSHPTDAVLALITSVGAPVVLSSSLAKALTPLQLRRELGHRV